MRDCGPGTRFSCGSALFARTLLALCLLHCCLQSSLVASLSWNPTSCGPRCNTLQSSIGASLRLRGGRSKEKAVGENQQGTGFSFGKAFGNKEAAKASSNATGGTQVKEAMFQLTTHLLGPKSSGKRDFYEVLGVSKTATHKEIRDGYYREARKWHPDKNKQDPQAEAKFKMISEAYEILGDEQKRKIYDESGREGLEAHEAFNNIDIKGVLRGLFGGGEFDDIFGDVAELPLVKGVMKHSKDVDEDADEDADEDPEKARKRRKTDPKEKSKEEAEAEEEAEQEEMEKLEKQLCKDLGLKLLERLEKRASGATTAEKLQETTKAWARELCDAPGGFDLVRMTSHAYRHQAKKYLRRWWGLEAIVTEVRDACGRVSQGWSLLMGAFKASRMTKEAIAKSKEKAAEEEEAGSGEEGKPKAQSPQRKAAKMSDEGDDSDEESEEINLDQADMLQIAKVGLDVVWRFGIFLLQSRVRLVAKAMMDTERERLAGRDDKEVRERMQAVAQALLEVGQAMKVAWEEASAAQPDKAKAGAPIQLE